MRSILFDVLEINIVITLVILILCLFAGKLRKRYGAMWLKVMWIVLMVRLLIPYNFSLPITEFRLFNVPGFEQEIEENAGSNVLNDNVQNVQPGVNADVMQGGVSQNVPTDNADVYVQENEFGGETNYESVGGNTADANFENMSGDTEGMSGDTLQVGELPISSEVSVENADNAAESSEATAEDARETGVFRYTDILLYMWLIGIGISAVYHIVVYLVMRRTYMKDLEPVKNVSLLQEINKMQKKYLGQKRLAVYESMQVQSPLITGILRPKLIIPSYEGDWNMDELELITAHELCHFRKKDLWLKMLMLTVTCFNWFNPAVYMMKKQFYYDMELVCDESVIRGRSKKEKETYAKILMSYAGKGRRNYTFMSGLAAGNKLTKNRIYHIWEDGNKKKGVVVFAVILVGFLGIGVFVSCGYKPGEAGDISNGLLSEDAVIDGLTGLDNELNGMEDGATEETQKFSYNNEYNKMMCIYNGKTYVARTDGIYVVEDGELICLYEDRYDWHRNLEIHEDALYFAGYVPDTQKTRSTIYQMDLNTFEVKDVLASLGEAFYGFYNITIREGNLYALNMDGYVGFALDDNGVAVSKLDENADDFIYKEDNELLALGLARLNANYGSPEGEKIMEQWKQSYYPIIDRFACAEMMDGKYVVQKYKDESTYSLYLTDGSGNYTYLADCGYIYPVIADEEGVYYIPDLMCSSIYFTDYQSGESRCVFDIPGGWEWVHLATYDDKYLYFNADIMSGWVGDEYINDRYIMRVPKEGGAYEVIYEITEERGYIAGHCGIDGEYMYFCDEYDGNRMIELKPVELADSYLVQIGDPVYRDLIREMLDSGKFPAGGSEWSGNPYDNYYAVADVDVDGLNELILYFPNGSSMAAMVYYVYDYDRATGEPYIQCSGFPDFTIYDNGYIIEMASHNHGRSNLDDFWPYRVLKYNEQTDTYECIANMDAWQLEYNSGNSEFPEEMDADGDGVVYYNWTAEEWDNPSVVMDNAEYGMWYQEITQGNVIEITRYQIITEEEYYELYPQPEANG